MKEFSSNASHKQDIAELMGLLKKKNLRRTQLRKSKPAERPAMFRQLANTDIVVSIFILLICIVLCVGIIAFELIQQLVYRQLAAISILVFFVVAAAGLYVLHYQNRIVKKHARAAILVGLIVFMLAITKIGAITSRDTPWVTSWVTGTAIIIGIILTIAYDQRFALGIAVFYGILGTLSTATVPSYECKLVGINLFITMLMGIIVCCFSLREIRTRMKLLEVGTMVAAAIFLTAACVVYLDFSGQSPRLGDTFKAAGTHAVAAFMACLLIQSFLPLIERLFNVATSMTLLDYSDANQLLLRRLAMEAPGTFSHSLLIGSIAEAAAESIGCNGLLCRVGAYYHDIGKINKPKYFVENEMGSTSRHKELSPAMSQLIIVGHVKDGIEMGKEYSLPGVLRQFVETHHGTTLVEPFYIEAMKKSTASPASEGTGKKPKEAPPSESEFRYPGPRPHSKEAAIVMLADSVEGAVRSLTEVTPAKVETVVHNMAMKRLQDGQFDECDISLRELSQVEASLSKALAAHYHGRIAYPTPPDAPEAAQPLGQAAGQVS